MMNPNESFPTPYTTASHGSGGRQHVEPDDPLRSPFELDRHRIIESTAFRRLEGKAQVFLAGRHDHFRTRLTHTLEVANVARTLAGALAANTDLAEAIALAHDLGHPPFGHAGEAALNEAMAAIGGFNHNVHSLRVVEYLEHPFPPFRGLNLTAATRAGLAAHTTRYDRPAATGPCGVAGAMESDTAKHSGKHGCTVEARIASLADRIAYNTHDLEDAIGAGLIGLDELKSVTLWQSALDRRGMIDEKRSIHAVRRVVLDEMLNTLLMDVVTHSRGALTLIQNPPASKACAAGAVGFSPAMDAQLTQLEGFLLHRVYKHGDVEQADAQGKQKVHALFQAYRKQPEMLPPRFASRIAEQGLDRVIGDYIAGMTDRFCARAYARYTIT